MMAMRKRKLRLSSPRSSIVSNPSISPAPSEQQSSALPLRRIPCPESSLLYRRPIQFKWRRILWLMLTQIVLEPAQPYRCGPSFAHAFVPLPKFHHPYHCSEMQDLCDQNKEPSMSPIHKRIKWGWVTTSLSPSSQSNEKNKSNKNNRRNPNEDGPSSNSRKNKDEDKESGDVPFFSKAKELDSTLLPPPSNEDRSSDTRRERRSYNRSRRNSMDTVNSRRGYRRIQHVNRKGHDPDRQQTGEGSSNNNGRQGKYVGGKSYYQIRRDRWERKNLRSNGNDNGGDGRKNKYGRRYSSGDRYSRNRSGGGRDSRNGEIDGSASSGFSKRTRRGNDYNYSSLLPPPLPETSRRGGTGERQMSTGLSSWEDFLGTANLGSDSNGKNRGTGNNSQRQSQASANSPSADRSKSRTSSTSQTGKSNFVSNGKSSNRSGGQQKKAAVQEDLLPSIDDLFPSLTTTPSASQGTPGETFTSPLSSSSVRNDSESSSPPLEGVLPVSDLFYHASTSKPKTNGAGVDGVTGFTATKPLPNETGASKPNNPKAETNPVQPMREGQQRQEQSLSSAQVEMIKKTTTTPSSGRRRKAGRKMVRRGMEMLVGGVPISADPPQRAVELFYNPIGARRDDSVDSEPLNDDWSSVITLNTDDFGPMLGRKGLAGLSEFEKGLYCEFFVDNAIKWGICPSDLQELVEAEQSRTARNVSTLDAQELSGEYATSPVRESKAATSDQTDSEDYDEDDDPFHDAEHLPTHDEEDEEDGMLSIILRPHRAVGGDGRPGGATPRLMPSAASASDSDDDDDMLYEFHIGTIEIGIGVPLSILSSSDREGDNESAEGDEGVNVMKSVLSAGVYAALENRLDGAQLIISHYSMSELDDGESTKIAADFVVQMSVTPSTADEEIVERAKVMIRAFSHATEGEISLAAANAAREEMRWSPKVRARVVEEFLDDDDDDEVPEEGEENQEETTTSPPQSGEKSELILPTKDKLIIPEKTLDLADASEIGLFYNCSTPNGPFAPYGGEIGLRLVDAVVERAKQRQPRVIAIGDVHGCIDELQDLLRQCQYTPGDIVVFLGDLVCKGPDSHAVVQMAREIGAIGVRGNHDFEVIRWHRAIKAGVDPPALRSEHFHIASCLSKADVKWMHNLPWYMSSKDLGALFVHAGFVSGIRLAKQNPRLMMNMRSILPDGTVTSKFFNNWPWARLWDGPQTVLFGHDADRGLQQYEHAIGLDTGCVYGGRLTACILPERKLVSVSARREYFKYRRKHYD